MSPRVLRRIAVDWMLVVGLLFALFAVGSAMNDPGGVTGAALSAAWIVPAVLLAWVAWTRPSVGERLVVPLATLVALAWLAVPFVSDELRRSIDDVGPVLPLATLAVAVSAAVLGLHRATLAGWLLLGLTVANLAGLVVADVVRDSGRPNRLGLLSTSGGVLVIPMLIAGALLLLAGWVARSHPASSTGRPAPA